MRKGGRRDLIKERALRVAACNCIIYTARHQLPKTNGAIRFNLLSSPILDKCFSSLNKLPKPYHQCFLFSLSRHKEYGSIDEGGSRGVVVRLWTSTTVQASPELPLHHIPSLPSFKIQRCLYRVRYSNKVGVTNAYFTLPT